MNLTRVPEDASISVTRNYMDSIAILSGDFPDVKTTIDVGSGAGLPGIPLAIMLPQVQFMLLDSLAKRVRFLEDVISALSLNADAVHGRAEETARDKKYREQFDLAISRGVAKLNILAEYTLPFVRPGGYMLALKGPSVEDETDDGKRAAQQLGGELTEVVSIVIPGTDWDHRGVWMKKNEPTAAIYPRTPAAIKKKPLQ